MSDKLLYKRLTDGIQELLDTDAKAGFESMGRSIGEQLFICHLYDYLSREVSPTSHALSEGFAHLLYQIYQEVQGIRPTDPPMDKGMQFLLIRRKEPQGVRIDSHLMTAIGADRTPIDGIAMNLLKFESDNTTVRAELPDSVAVLSLCVECAGVIVSRRSNVSSTCSNACRTAGSRRDRLRDPERKDIIKGQTQQGQEILRQVSLQLAELLRDRSLQTLEKMGCPAELKAAKGKVSKEKLRAFTGYGIEKFEEQYGRNDLRMGYSIKIDGLAFPLFNPDDWEPNDEAKKVIRQLKTMIKEKSSLYLGDLGDEKRAKLAELCPGHPYTNKFPKAERADVRERRLTAAQEAFHWKREGANAFKFKMKGISGKTNTTKLDRLEMMEKAEEIVAERKERAELAKKALKRLVLLPTLVIHDSLLQEELDEIEEGGDEWNEILDEALEDGRASFEPEEYPEVDSSDIERFLEARITAQMEEEQFDQMRDDRAEAESDSK